MYIHPVYSISFLIITILLTYFFVKRLGKSGFGTYAYIGLVIFCINIFTITSWGFMYGSVEDLVSVTTSGQKYDAKVISYTTEQHYDSDDDREYTMYQPTVQFTTDSGKIIESELEFSTSSLEIGDTYKINYNEENDKIVTLGFTLIIKLVGVFIFCLILTFLSAGIIKFALGHTMDGYKDLVSKVGYYFFIPFLMIGFNLLLLYGAFYGNEVPWYVTLILLFFSVMLFFGTWGYLKMMINNGEPKMKRVGPNKWAGDWEDKKGNSS